MLACDVLNEEKEIEKNKTETANNKTDSFLINMMFTSSFLIT
jgi:hypothetical protein